MEMDSTIQLALKTSTHTFSEKKKPLALKNLCEVFYLIIAGHLLASAAFLIELYYIKVKSWFIMCWKL